MEVEYVIGLSGTFARALLTTYSVRTLNTRAQTRIGHEVMIGRTHTSCLPKLLEYLEAVLPYGEIFPPPEMFFFSLEQKVLKDSNY